ncbi:methyltransferase domain-containing protein [Patescibacteria group bacterium]|nr:methyltransferase domain-containing protein [Patescibacteria group bacterium]
MEKYIFMLGQSAELAKEELISFLGSVENSGPSFALATSPKKPAELIKNLGGTIKIAQYIDTIDDLSPLFDIWLANINIESGKTNFGFSLYNDKKNYPAIKKISMAIKKDLKSQGHKCRFVSSREPILSSVIVTKNNLINNELLIIRNNNQYIIGITRAVQDFASYGLRDMERPNRDDKSGLLPPKIAQIMLNLAGPDRQKNILDPFCGSGTILQEAALLGFNQIYGSDISKKAISDSQANLDWLAKKFAIKINYEIRKSDINNLSENFKNNSIDLIVTEPFMGDARQVSRAYKISDLKNIQTELQKLYHKSFLEFKKILKPGGVVIFIFPEFVIKNDSLKTLDEYIIANIGFRLNKNLVYFRPDQKVRRQITVWHL